MKSLKIFFCIAVLAITATSCRKSMPEANRPYDFQRKCLASAFESFWTGMNNNYIFWDIDPTDWDAVYDLYQPKFAQLNINESDDIITAYKYFIEMTKDLADGHYAILIDAAYRGALAEAGYGFLIRPSDNRYMQRSDYRAKNDLDNFIFTELPDRYLNNWLRGVASVSGDLLYMLQGFVDNTSEKNICYFYFSGFNIHGYFSNPDDISGTSIAIILDELFSALEDPTLDGVIIDLRGNGGGSVVDMDLLWSNFLMGKEFLAGFRREKIGEGRLDYGPRVPHTYRPVSYVPVNTNPAIATIPIVVLADVHSVSCAEISTMALSHLPNGYFVGETTWGGQGNLLQSNTSMTIFNAGTFNNFFMNLVYTPFVMIDAPNGKNYEGKGFSPKDAPRGYEIKHDEAFAADIAIGKDRQLEKAIDIIINR
ncbi:MAG: S41 family peptidase [Bacteroidales bacterium]|nr:S41 family peptidase [Bacteroidales bacterium]